MVDNFIIVLFKNKIKKKIINKFKTSKKAESFYYDLIDKSEKVTFEKKFENSQPCDFHIGLLTKHGSEETIYTSDDLGRNIKVNLEDEFYQFKKISQYKIEEKIFDLQNKNKITINELKINYLNGVGLKMISSLNNKVIIQKEENSYLFSLKNIDDSHRFLDSLRSNLINEGKTDFLFIKDIDSSQRSYLYDVLKEKGYDKKMLYRTKTTYLPR